MELSDVPYKVSYRNIKYPRIEFGSGNLHFVLPFSSEPEAIYEKHKKWILKKIEFIEECLKEASKVAIVERTKREFKELIYSFVKKTSEELYAEINKIFFRTMKTKWASCSVKRNLTINKLMKCLPENLLKYIVFHEIAHLKQKRHNDKFWEIISKKFNNYEALEKELFVYWFKLATDDSSVIY